MVTSTEATSHQFRSWRALLNSTKTSQLEMNSAITNSESLERSWIVRSSTSTYTERRDKETLELSRRDFSIRITTLSGKISGETLTS
jgi:hypothetical protein